MKFVLNSSAADLAQIESDQSLEIDELFRLRRPESCLDFKFRPDEFMVERRNGAQHTTDPPPETPDLIFTKYSSFCRISLTESALDLFADSDFVPREILRTHESTGSGFADVCDDADRVWGRE